MRSICWRPEGNDSMPDMLVKLYALPDPAHYYARAKASNIIIRRPIGPEKHHTIDWVRQVFSIDWAGECDVSFSSQPPTCYLAVRDGKPYGFACYDTTCRGFFGPIGVMEDLRGQGIGAALLLATLYGMREAGYGYAIIGAAGPTAFYSKVANAVAIPDSVPGVYLNRVGGS
jgi:GNAT superfamily N-acetyltransferase